MSKESVFKEGSGSRKGFVSKFQTENNLDMQTENNISKIRNKIFNKSSENMSELVDNCISLTVTSPPYNVGKLSDLDLDDKNLNAHFQRGRGSSPELRRTTNR